MSRDAPRRAALRRAAMGTLLGAFEGTEVPRWALDLARDGIAGFVLFGTNIGDASRLAALCAELRAAHAAPIIAIDEEGGVVTRLYRGGGSPSPGNGVLGSADDVAPTRQAYAAIGADLARRGINLDLAPVADVNSSSAPDAAPPAAQGALGRSLRGTDAPGVGFSASVIGARSFGADPALVARHTAAAVSGLADAGVAGCAKHFPGYGAARVDSHRALPTIDVPLGVLRSRDLPPFAAAVASGVAAVMTGHVRVPALTGDAPATFSAAATRLLREDLGFGGVIVTDALEMRGALEHSASIPAGAVLALAAGADLLCLGHRATPELIEEVVAAIIEAIEAGRLSLADIERSATRTARLATARDHASPADAGPRPRPTARRTGVRTCRR